MIDESTRCCNTIVNDCRCGSYVLERVERDGIRQALSPRLSINTIEGYILFYFRFVRAVGINYYRGVRGIRVRKKKTKKQTQPPDNEIARTKKIKNKNKKQQRRRLLRDDDMLLLRNRNGLPTDGRT